MGRARRAPRAARPGFEAGPPTGYVAGLDPSDGMLAVARELLPSVDWRRHGAAGSIPSADASFVEDAGAGPVEISTRKGIARFPSIRVMVEADLRGWLPLVGVNLGEGQIRRILQEAEGVLAGYAADDGCMAFDTSAHVVTARKR